MKEYTPPTAQVVQFNLRSHMLAASNYDSYVGISEMEDEEEL